MPEISIVAAVPWGPGITRIEFRTPNNTLTLELIRKLRSILREHRRDSAQRVLIFCGAGERFFSPGLDLNQVLPLDRGGMSEFMTDFCAFYLELFSHPKPTLARLAGHALAGGCILACCCDYRLAADSIRIGFTPLNRFFPLPAGSQQILAFRLGPGVLSRSLYQGSAVGAAEAVRLGWVDRVTDAGSLEREVLGLARSLSDGLPRAFEISKRNLLGDLPRRIAESDRLQVDEFLDGWFAPETRSYLESMTKR